jgi:cold shock CspA family protein
MPEGSIVEFDISTADGKTEAIQVRPIEGMTTGSLIGREVSGELTKKAHSQGFITLDVGGTIFFHMRDCGSSTAFKKLKIGDRVKFKVSMAANGKRFAENLELYSGQPVL